MPGSGEIRKLRRRVESVENTKKITRAMEMIAASRILKAQRRVREARPYAEMITDVIRGLATANEVKDHPLLMTHDDVDAAAILVVTSDRGLAGAYNSNVLKLAERTIAEERDRGHDPKLFIVGKKGVSYFTYRGRQPQAAWQGLSDQPDFDTAAAIASEIMDRYAEGNFQKVWLVYTDFQSSLTQVPARMELLPVDPTEFEGGEELPAEFMYEPDPQEILDLLIPRYVEAKVFHALLESAASEHASRQRAMKNATDNAEEVVENLRRQMNQARQAQITTEITEIVGGAEALSESA